MNQHPRNRTSDRSVLRQIESRLDELVNLQHGIIPHLHTSTTVATSPTSSTEDRSLDENDNSSARMSWEDQILSKSTEETHESSVDITLPLIMEPTGLWNTLKNRPSSRLADSQLQEWFVEMCFFARLGFVQPPSCLKCMYRQAIQKCSSDGSCHNWVVWRKHARVLLHPTKLKGNVVLVQCRAISDLLSQNVVEGHSWDADKTRLLRR